MKRIRAATAAVAETQRLSSEYAQITRDAVREMRATMSYGEVARALSLSRSRIQQLEK